MNKQPWKSKLFWQNIVLIIGGIGSLFVGDLSFEQALPKIAVAILGILGVVFRWNTEKPLGMKK